MKTCVEFCIFGGNSADYMIKSIGLNPSSFYSKGEKNHRTGREKKESCLCFSTEKEELYDVSDQINFILKKITPFTKKIIELLSEGCTTQISVVVYFSQNETKDDEAPSFPSINMTAEILKFFTDLSCSLDVDIV